MIELTHTEPAYKPIPKDVRYHPLGHIIDFKKDVLASMRQMAQKHPELVQLRVGPKRLIMVQHPELVREVLVKRAAEFPKAAPFRGTLSKALGNGLVPSDGKFHAGQRKMMQSLFHHKRMEAYSRVMTNYTADLLKEWERNPNRDLHNDMMRLTMFIVSKTLFNADKRTMAKDAQRAADAIASNQIWIEKEFWLGFKMPDWVPTRGNRQFKKNHQTLQEILMPIIEQRMRTNIDHGDLLTTLINARNDAGRPMPKQQIFDEVNNLFSAGHETTANTLIWTFYLLGKNRHVTQKLTDEIDQVLQGRCPTMADLDQLPYAAMVLKESMRLFPAVWSLAYREVQRDTTVGDYRFPKGSWIVISPYALHRQEAYFPNPEVFKPERFHPTRASNIPRYAYLPFGAGPRVCIGAQFAMIEAQLILIQLLQTFNFEIVPGQSIIPRPLITISPENGLNIKVTRRSQ